MAFLIQSTFRKFIALKAVGERAKETLAKRKTKKELLELYKQRHERV
jgi:hypothetical protein